MTRVEYRYVDITHERGQNLITTRSKHLGLRYLWVADTLRQKIIEGECEPGQRLPRQHDMAKDYNVALSTLKQALDLLENEGYVVRKVGVGTWAALPQDDTPVALIVCDEQRYRGSLAMVLADRGWHCVAVESGELALDQLRARRFDVIFLDLVMPGLNGAETLRGIRAVDPEAVVVLITAYPDSDPMAEVLEIGPVTVMNKPLTLDQVSMVLGNIVVHTPAALARAGRIGGQQEP